MVQRWDAGEGAGGDGSARARLQHASRLETWTYSDLLCALRCSAQRRFCAAAILLRASGLKTLFFLLPVDLPAEAEVVTANVADVLPPSCFLILAISASISFLLSSNPTSAASSVVVSGDAVRPRGMISPSAIYHGLKL